MLFRSLAGGGTFVEIALATESPAVSLFGLVQGGLRMAGTCAYSYANYEAAVGHIAAGRVPADAIISERVSLDDTPSALARLRTPGDLVRILSLPGEVSQTVETVQIVEAVQADGSAVAAS